MHGLFACSEAYKFGQFGRWVVLVQVIYCSKNGWVLFLEFRRHPEEEIPSYSHRRKLDLPRTHISPFSKWCSIFFLTPLPPPLKPRSQGRVMGLIGGVGGSIAIATALPPSFCVLYYKHQIVYGISLPYLLRQAVQGVCWSASHLRLTTFPFRSSEVRRLLSDLDPYGAPTLWVYFLFFVRELLMFWPPILE